MQFREDLRADSDTNSAMSAAGSATPIPSSGNRFDSSQDSMETPQKRDNVDDDSISKANAALNASLGINMTPMANKRDSRGSGDSGNSGDTTTYYPLDVAHYPSAMPTPLFRHHNQQPHNMPMSPPLSNPSFLPTPPPGYTMLAPPSHDIVILPDGSNMLTHFDILNRHIMDVAGSLHQSQNTTREQVINNALRKHEDGLKAIGEHFGDVRSQLNAVEHNLGRTTGAMDDVVTNMSKLVETVQTELLGRVEKLVNANTDLTNKVEALTSRLAELEKKHDDAATASRIEASPPPHVQQAQPQQTVPAHMQSMHVQHPQGLYYDTNGNLYGMSQGYQYYAQAHAMSKEQMMLMNPDERARKAAEDWNAHHHQRGRHDRRGDGGHYEARGRFDGANSAGGYEQNGVGYHRHS